MTKPSPVGSITPFQLWTPAPILVAGQWYHRREIQAVCRISGRTITTPVYLVHVEDNRFDRNAVEVRAAAGLLGFLPRNEARRYAPVLDDLQRRGQVVEADARVWARWWRCADGVEAFRSDVTIDVPEPHLLFPRNSPPSMPHTLLPIGRAAAVTTVAWAGEDLTRYLDGDPACWVYATLHEVPGWGAPGEPVAIEVAVDGATIGRLAHDRGVDLFPVLRVLTDRAELAAARALIEDGTPTARVAVHAPTRSELPAGWLQAGAGRRSSDNRRPTAAPQVAAELRGMRAAQAAWPGGEPPAPMPAPSWYPDPFHVSRLRYWDGESWTYATAP